MKKYFVFVLTLTLSVLVMADDIIITRNSQRINAKIEKVGVDVIEYRRSDNLTGPLYSIQKSEISSVLYDNGTVETFENQRPAAQNYGNNGNNYYSLNDPITYDSGNFYQNGRQLSDYDLRKINGAAYNDFVKSKKLIGAGWGTFAAGIAFTIPIGVPLMVCCEWEGYYAGISLIAIGAGLTTASIPLLAVGYVKRGKSIEKFNYPEQRMSLNLISSQNGVGLALNF